MTNEIAENKIFVENPFDLFKVILSVLLIVFVIGFILQSPMHRFSKPVPAGLSKSVPKQLLFW